MDQILSTPMEIRLLALFVIGACLGGAVNWAIYSLAWFSRPISPWSRPDPSAPPRRFSDRLPIVGWLGLRREAPLHGTGFWVRPMLLEVFAGLGLAWLYWWEVGLGRLMPFCFVNPSVEFIQANPHITPSLIMWALYLQFAAHSVLIALMLAGSMIDIDEKIIPDEITVTGTLVGLLMAAAWPWSLLPTMIVQGNQIGLDFLHAASPNDWPACLSGRPLVGSLLLGLGCWWLWCAALLPRTWYRRHGLLRAMRLCWARMIRMRTTYRILRMAIFGSAVIVLMWFRGDSGWQGLLSALVGMAAGGMLIWLVRLIGSAALGREAMGFGDVTLMAMIGAFLGWQSCILIFFLAPLAGVAVGLLRLVVLRDKEIPYGPFLCLAALLTIVCWNGIWNYTQDYFAIGWLVPAAMAGCLILMGLMLGAWRLFLSLIRKGYLI